MASKIELFYSKSKSKADLGKPIPADWRRQLSNFWPQEVEVDGRKYPNPEAAFQAAKALMSSKPEMAKEFEVGGSIGPDPADAKKAGSKKAYKAAGATLKAADWDQVRNEAMMNVLKARYASDPMFRQILEATLKSNILLLHYERIGAKSYWGGAVKDGEIVGENMLGRLLMTLRLRGAEASEAASAAASEETAQESAAAAAPVATPSPQSATTRPVAPPEQDAKPSMASMGRASESVGAVSLVRKVFTARAILLKQLAALGYTTRMWNEETPAEIDMRIQNKELNFVLEPSGTMNEGATHIRFHIEKALRHIHINALADEFAEMAGYDRSKDTIILISKDLPNDSVKSALESVYATKGIYIIVRALQELQFNILEHKLVPKQTKLTPPQTQYLKKRFRIQDVRKQLPGISRFDPAARAIQLRPGQVVKILRPSVSSGYTDYYRVCQ